MSDVHRVIIEDEIRPFFERFPDDFRRAFDVHQGEKARAHATMLEVAESCERLAHDLAQEEIDVERKTSLS